ncbi:MAG: ABC transporter substrate-binding protein [Dehalococcoidia bacterium]
MAEELNYWQRLHRKRMSRRRILGSAAAGGVGLAGLAIVGCGDDDDGGGATATEGEEPTEEATVAPGDDDEPTAEPTEEVVDPGAGLDLEPVGTTGGTYRYFGFDALTLDSYDPHQTQFGPIYNLHSAVFSKVLTYLDEYQEIIAADLSDGLPEQVDDITYTIKLRGTATYQNNSGLQAASDLVGQRTVTADDVKFMMDRQVNDASPASALYYRRSQWNRVDSVEVVDDTTLTVTMKEPTSAFIHFLADRNNYIVPPELVDAEDSMNDPTKMLGSGPFMLDRFEALVTTRAVRNPDWFGADDNPGGVGTGRPFIDAYEADGSQIVQTDDTAQRLAFESKQKDVVGFDDNNLIEEVMGSIPDLVLVEAGVGGYVNSRLVIDRPPFNDVRVRQALHLAVDRQLLGQKLFQQFFRPSANIAWPMTRWALPQEEVLTLPGYRVGTAEREEDIQTARDLWAAAGGNEAIGDLDVFFATIPGYIPQLALPEFQQRLQENLGAVVTTRIDETGYTNLAQCLLLYQQGEDGNCPFTWGYDNGWIHWFDWLYPYFHSTGAKNSFLMNDPEMDRMLDEAATIFDYDEAHERILEIQRYLLSPDAPDAAFAQIPYINDLGRTISWPYVKNRKGSSWFGHLDVTLSNLWIDSTDPTYEG